MGSGVSLTVYGAKRNQTSGGLEGLVLRVSKLKPLARLEKLKPHDCPKYPRCSAAVCPFDFRWHQRIHKEDEEVCHLLRISQTEKAESFFATYFEPGFLEELKSLIPTIVKRYPSMANIVSSKDGPLTKPWHPKKYQSAKPRVKSSPEVYAQQMREYTTAAAGGPASDLNSGVDTFPYPEEAIIE